MPISLTKQELVTTRVIDTCKIAEIEINVSTQKIRIKLDYGSIVPENTVDGVTTPAYLGVVEGDTIMISDTNFFNIASKQTAGNKSIYDELSTIVYSWLIENGKLKYGIS